jgi:two-component system, cell cycle sensor histidine kinase and response regulator CckA
MPVDDDSLSVLVVDDETEVLSFFARILDANGMRALLARNPGEAIGIAKRGYVPINLVLTDVSLKPDAATPDLRSGSELADRLRELRPEVRVLYMSAWLDSEVIRIELMGPGFQTTSQHSDHRGLIESIRNSATAPLVQRAGGSTYRT